MEPPDPYADLPNQPGVRQRLVVRATIVFALNSSVNAPNDLNPSYDGNDFFTNSHTSPNENAAVYPASM